MRIFAALLLSALVAPALGAVATPHRPTDVNLHYAEAGTPPDLANAAAPPP